MRWVFGSRIQGLEGFKLRVSLVSGRVAGLNSSAPNHQHAPEPLSFGNDEGPYTLCPELGRFSIQLSLFHVSDA